MCTFTVPASSRALSTKSSPQIRHSCLGGAQCPPRPFLPPSLSLPEHNNDNCPVFSTHSRGLLLPGSLRVGERASLGVAMQHAYERRDSPSQMHYNPHLHTGSTRCGTDPHVKLHRFNLLSHQSLNCVRTHRRAVPEKLLPIILDWRPNHRIDKRFRCGRHRAANEF